MIITRTPFRISFFGGGSDYPAWYKDHIGMVLGASIDKYCYLTIDYSPKFIPHRYRLVYSGIEHCQVKEQIQHPGVRGTLEHLGIDTPMEILHASDLPSQSGMGSSSAFIVGLLTALTAQYKHYLVQPPTGIAPLAFAPGISQRHWAEMATTIEQDVLREPVGSQDQIVTAMGGIKQIVWHPEEPEPAIRSIELTPERVREFERHLMLIYTGPRGLEISDSTNLQDNTKTLQELAHMAKAGTDILTGDHDIRKFGYLLHSAWELKKQLASNITTNTADSLYRMARDHGAIGGKLLGAGGGGFMLIFAAPNFHGNILAQLPPECIHVPFRFENEGSVVLHAS